MPEKKGTKNNRKSNIKKSNNQENQKTKKYKMKKKQKHPMIGMAIKIFIILFLIVAIIGTGIFAGIFFGLFGDDFDISKEDLIISNENSVMVDSEGNVIANLNGDEKREIITLAEMSTYLPKAYIAIEDERFYTHNGVDIMRTGKAIITYILNGGNASFGGSTITQQLVKNATKEKDKTWTRKVKEWAKAYKVERMLSKNQILEQYLNILFVGGDNICGVELGAQYYFNKSAKDLSLAQSAFLAGINHSPNAYNPYGETDRTEKIKSRTKTVLNKMKELGSINEEEYNTAVAEVEAGFKFEKAETSGNNYSYHTDAALKQVIEELAEAKGWEEQFAEKYVYSKGLTIHTTQVSSIQKELETEFAKEKYQITSSEYKDKDGKTIKQTSEAAMTIIDHKTGYVVGTVGGLGEKEAGTLNRSTQSLRQTGSAMKILASVVPGLEEKKITAATVYDDSKTVFATADKYSPKNYNYFRGLITVRDCIETSQNVPMVKIMSEITPKKSIEYLKKMGITSLDEKEDNGLSLAIGGLTNGISPLEMAGAYACIANDGEYIEPTFYTKVVDSNGNVILEKKQEKERVISKETAYIVKNILTQPVVGRQGTAKKCAIKGIEVGAKTGTTNGDKDRWLCGITPYYTAATWYGFDFPVQVKTSGISPATQLWSAVMTNIHKGLESTKFEVPSNIVTAKVCKASGKLATTECTTTYTEIFVKGTIPEECDGHKKLEICKDTGKIANEYCKNKEKKYYNIKPEKEDTKAWTTEVGKKYDIITEICTEHKKPEEKPVEAPQINQNNTNTNTGTSGGENEKPSTGENVGGETSGGTNQEETSGGENEKPSTGENIGGETSGGTNTETNDTTQN